MYFYVKIINQFYKMAPQLIANTPSQWGPMIWNMIHVASLKIGGGQRFEKNATKLFIELTKVLPAALPCRTCQGHAREFIAANRGRIVKWNMLSGDELKAAIVHFFWEFHNNANAVKDSPAPFYEFEQLMATYSTDDALNRVRAELPILLKTISTASLHGMIHVDAARQFKVILRRLASLAINGYV